MMSLREYREPKHRLPDYLPWACLVAPGVILQKDAVLQQTIAFRGPDLNSSLDSELISATARINNALRRLGSGWALFVEAQRFAAHRYAPSNFDNPAAWLVDLERRRTFEAAGGHYESSYYMTFVWQMPPEVHGRVAALFYDDPESALDVSSTLHRDLQYFQRTVAEVVDILAGVFPEIG